MRWWEGIKKERLLVKGPNGGNGRCVHVSILED